MNNNENTVASSVSQASIFMTQVYQWMTLALMVTAMSALMVASSPSLMQIFFGNTIIMFAVILSPFALVIYLNSAIHKLSSGAATGLFLLYSALMGISLSTIFLTYSQTAIVQAFICSAGTFAALSLYGTVTKRDLSPMASFLFMGLVGLIIVSVVNIFVGSSMLNFLISFVGILVFAGLTAYDTQNLRRMGESAPMGDHLAIRRGSILGAIQLYLNFINLFLFFLRFFGSNND